LNSWEETDQVLSDLDALIEEENNDWKSNIRKN
jgi:hypothetical protein